MKQLLTIVKIGGAVIDNPQRMKAFLTKFSNISGNKILVHGGGKLATKWANRLGISQMMVEGRRITDTDTLDVVTMVYAGLISKKVVAELVAHKVKAIGLSGADVNLIESGKQPVKKIDYGFVGNIKKVNVMEIVRFLQTGIVPVFCALTHNGKGQLLNTNADTLVAEIAKAMTSDYKVKLFYCFEKKGVLRDMDDENSVLTSLSYQFYQSLKEKGYIFAGMIPKLDHAFEAKKEGVDEVRILRAEDLDQLRNIKVNYGTKIEI